MQTPVGFLVDRIGARMVLIVGLAVSTVAYAIAGLADSYWVFIAMYGLGGLGNTVFHPADYSLLSHHAPRERLGQVFAFHTFAGIVGSAIAPGNAVVDASLFWLARRLCGRLGSFGVIVLFALIAQPEPSAETSHAANAPAKYAGGCTAGAWRVLLSPPILLNLGYFILTSIMGGGLNTYLVVALGALHATPLDDRQHGADQPARHECSRRIGRRHVCGRTSHHALVAASGFWRSAASSPRWSGCLDFHAVGLIMMMGLRGFFVGATYPSRDMLVRAVTPAGAYGLVFGFVASDTTSARASRRSIYGALMDNGMPRVVFYFRPPCSIAASRPSHSGFPSARCGEVA